jgi:hypothetical protein
LQNWLGLMYTIGWFGIVMTLLQNVVDLQYLKGFNSKDEKSYKTH